MRSNTLLFIALLVVTVLASAFFGGRQINATIERSIEENLSVEIRILREKLDKQAELIASIIGISSGSTDSSSSDTSKPSGTEGESKSDFEYIKENGGITLTRYCGKSTSVTIPDKIDGTPVLKIGERAFSETSVKSVTLPSGCREIDWFAFYGCFSLSTVYMPASVTEIGYGAFDSCARSLTIYCQSGSYAQKYAQSFGISYSEIK